MHADLLRVAWSKTLDDFLLATSRNPSGTLNKISNERASAVALAALASASVFAQSSVTISGGLVFGVGTTKTGTTSSGTQMNRQTGNIAFKGVEDLGGGLKAGFEAQTTLGAAAGSASNVANAALPTSTLGDRGSYMFLEGDFGKVQAGRASSAVRGLVGAIGDVSGLAVQSGLSAGAGASGDDGARVIYGDAYSNYVAYTSPAMNGFQASVALVPVEGNTASTGDTKSYTLSYANGPLSAAYNLTDSKQTVAAVAANTFTTGAFSAGPAATTAATYSAAVSAQSAYKMHSLFASYDLGVAKVGLMNQSIKLASGVNPGNGTTVTVGIPMGSGQIGAGYGKRSASASEEAVFGDDVKQRFVGYRYNLSKRTNVQFVTNKIDRAGTAKDVTENHVYLAHTF